MQFSFINIAIKENNNVNVNGVM